jgi:hypothetical protein
MVSRFSIQSLQAHLRHRDELAPCQSRERREPLERALVTDMACLLCAMVDYFSVLVIRRGQTAVVLGAKGNERNPSVTVELTRGRRRVAHLHFGDPLLRMDRDSDERRCLAVPRNAHSPLQIFHADGSLADLLAMRALIFLRSPGRHACSP